MPGGALALSRVPVTAAGLPAGALPRVALPALLPAA